MDRPPKGLIRKKRKRPNTRSAGREPKGRPSISLDKDVHEVAKRYYYEGVSGAIETLLRIDLERELAEFLVKKYPEGY